MTDNAIGKKVMSLKTSIAKRLSDPLKDDPSAPRESRLRRASLLFRMSMPDPCAAHSRMSEPKPESPRARSNSVPSISGAPLKLQSDTHTRVADLADPSENIRLQVRLVAA